MRGIIAASKGGRSGEIIVPLPHRLTVGVTGGGQGLRLGIGVVLTIKGDLGGVGAGAVRLAGGLGGHLIGDGCVHRLHVGSIIAASEGGRSCEIIVPLPHRLAVGVTGGRNGLGLAGGILLILEGNLGGIGADAVGLAGGLGGHSVGDGGRHVLHMIVVVGAGEGGSGLKTIRPLPHRLTVGVAGGGDDLRLGIGVVLTIAASGSEMSSSSVITNEETKEKRGCAKTDYCRPKFAILNPRLTYTLPQYQTESGCVDILMHTMERYFVNIETMEITDSISESLMQTVIYNARILMKEPDNYSARAEIMWAGSLSHNGLTGCGTGGGDWACHQLEHELGGVYDVTHGAGLAAIWGSWARYVYEVNPERFAQFATNVFDIPCGTDFKETALAGIEAMENFFRSVEMPTSLHELGLDLTDQEIHDLAFKCSFEDTRTIGVFKQLNMKDMEKIYQMAR